MLAEIRSYLQQRGRASLADIALHFDSEPDALRGMLEVWMRKGRVVRQTATASCGSSCSKCGSAATEIYVWAEAGTDAAGSLPDACPRG